MTKWITDIWKRNAINASRGMDDVRLQVTGEDTALVPLSTTAAREHCAQVMAVVREIERKQSRSVRARRQ